MPVVLFLRTESAGTFLAVTTTIVCAHMRQCTGQCRISCPREGVPPERWGGNSVFPLSGRSNRSFFVLNSPLNAYFTRRKGFSSCSQRQAAGQDPVESRSYGHQQQRWQQVNYSLFHGALRMRRRKAVPCSGVPFPTRAADAGRRILCCAARRLNLPRGQA